VLPAHRRTWCNSRVALCLRHEHDLARRAGVHRLVGVGRPLERVARGDGRGAERAAFEAGGELFRDLRAGAGVEGERVEPEQAQLTLV